MEHDSSDKEGIKILTDLLVDKGVRRVVLSPGSRNAPLIISFVREKRLEHFVVVDERSAAFFALGMAQQSGELVALVCTSGTAPLNYAPAVAEAWYQRIPLVIISADRPVEWIDQDDSQTIRQNGMFDRVVKATYQLSAEIHDEDERWYTNRLINDALNCALKGRKGPVHINVPLREPLYGTRIYPEERQRNMVYLDTVQRLSEETMFSLFIHWRESLKVMVLAGFNTPDEELREALLRLSGLPQVVVLSESLSNLGRYGHIGTIDRVLATISGEERKVFAPDLLITFGGPLISKHVKVFLRTYPPRFHWSIDKSDHPADTFKNLTTQINLEAKDFFPVLSKGAEAVVSGYAQRWREKKELAGIRHREYIARAAWSDLKAFSVILPIIPAGIHLQLSNSTPARYSQLFDEGQVIRTDGNRGTSGIDGCTSTAVGAACVTEGITLFMTGDMGFLYDSNALWNRYITPSLKIIVMKNGGGGIFRFLPGSSEVEELEECFETAQEVNVRVLAELYHFEYYKAANVMELTAVLPVFFSRNDRPVILEVETPRFENTRILREYFEYLSL